MTLSQLSSRKGILSVTATVSAVVLTWAALFCSFNPSHAQDAKQTAVKVAEADPEYAVPDGTPDEIMEFVDTLKARKPKFASRKEMMDHVIRLNRALIEAGDKILSQETSVRVAVKAVKMKLTSLTLLATNQIGDAADEAIAAATTLRMDERPEVVKAVDPFWTTIRIINLAMLAPADRTQLADEIVSSLSKSRFARNATTAAMQYGDTLANKGLTEEAGDFYDRLAKLADESDDPEIQSSAKRYEGQGRRARLPGHFMAIEGKLLNGDAFDWVSYRGKVVLVDFWATWCGPCIAELPNVKTNYENYHDKGFEVVGISLDRSREPLDMFIEKEEIPWAQMYDEEIQQGKGWNHPLAEQFGINAIPAAILVDQKGNVVSLRARGPELTKLLEDLLGKTE